MTPRHSGPRKGTKQSERQRIIDDIGMQWAQFFGLKKGQKTSSGLAHVRLLSRRFQQRDDPRFDGLWCRQCLTSFTDCLPRVRVKKKQLVATCSQCNYVMRKVL